MSSPRFFGKLRKSKSKRSSSPPDRLPVDNEEVMSSSFASTNNSMGGFYSTTPPSFHVDGNTSPLSISPNTPKKEWETNYKTYLSHQGEEGQYLSSDASTENLIIGMRVPNLEKSSQGVLSQSYTPTTNSIPINNRHKSHDALDMAGRGHSRIINVDSDESGKSYGSERRPRTFSRDFRSAQDGNSKSVHGGNFFSGMFGKKKKDDEKNRADSFESLDSAMRKGAEVAIPVKDTQTMSPRTKQRALLQPGLLIGPRDVKKLSRKDKRRQKQIAFTQFHNSNKYATDTTAPYLGEEKSVQKGNNFASLRDLKKEVDSLAAVAEESLPVLTPIEGPDKWESNRRYLMAPAIMAICPSNVYSLFQDKRKDASQDNGDAIFHSKNLGVAQVSQIKPSGLVKEEYHWTSRHFVLHQNYLLEHDKPSERPKGFAFLQNCSIRKVEETINLLRFDYYQPERSSRKSILIKLNSESERDYWLATLLVASRLKVEDLYEFDGSGYGPVLGRGRYAKVFPGRRRRKRGRNEHGDASVNNTNSQTKNGILKKKPSFTSIAHLNSTLKREDCDCALKVIDKHKFWDRVQKGQERADTIVREASVQAALLASEDIYPGFLAVKSFFETMDKVVLELELLKGIDLYNHISSTKCVSEVEASNIMFDIISCLEAMQRCGIAHRDIKPANILMADANDPQGLSVKLGDFGMATFVGEDGLVRGRCGTPGFVAPEIFEAKVNGGYENKVDMFSAGVLMYVLLCGYEPFSFVDSEKELIKKNEEAKVPYPSEDWASISIEGRDLVEKMLERDPSKRIDPKKALQHPWITRRATDKNISVQRNRKEVLENFACTIS